MGQRHRSSFQDTEGMERGLNSPEAKYVCACTHMCMYAYVYMCMCVLV